MRFDFFPEQIHQLFPRRSSVSAFLASPLPSFLCLSLCRLSSHFLASPRTAAFDESIATAAAVECDSFTVRNRAASQKGVYLCVDQSSHPTLRQNRCPDVKRGDQATIHARDGRAVSAVEAAAGVQGRASGNRGRGASPFCATGKMAGGGDIDRNGWMVGGRDGLGFGGGGRMGQKRERGRERD